MIDGGLISPGGRVYGTNTLLNRLVNPPIDQYSAVHCMQPVLFEAVCRNMQAMTEALRATYFWRLISKLEFPFKCLLVSKQEL